MVTIVDWNAVRTEYITNRVSLRALATKYGVSLTEVNKHSRREKWSEMRAEAVAQSARKAIQKTASLQADNATKLERARGMLIDRALESIEAMNEPLRVASINDLKALTEIVEKLAAASGGSDESLRRLDALIGAIDDAAHR